MKPFWSGKNAIVTGEASGIGFALAAELVARGARVWAADIDVAGAKRAAASPGSGVQPVTLDVRDAAAFRDFVEGVARDAAGIDFLFNNAGILCIPGKSTNSTLSSSITLSMSTFAGLLTECLPLIP